MTSVVSDRTDAEPGASENRWARTAGLVTLVSLGIVLAYWDSAASMVAIWYRSETFAHGFLIVPISLWLVWEKRHALHGLAAVGSGIALLGMIPVGAAWLLGYVVDVLVVQQFAFVGMLILGIWAVLGDRLARLLAFPLGFLLFAVPVGEGLIYPMMNFTADFTVAMLRATGIPVFREGLFFSIPTGDWSVVEACSGVRYLIASVTLGAIYAYLTYTKLWKRLLFCLFAVAVPILANGLRAYMIVMIGHLSGMKYAVGVDHLIYGWVFFGIVITIMFFIGSFWRDPVVDTEPSQFDQRDAGPARFGVLTAAVLAVVAAAAWPALGWYGDQVAGARTAVHLAVPEGTDNWAHGEASGWDWRPHIVNPHAQSYHFYRGPGATVGLYLGVYATQGDGAELVNSQNQMVVQQHPVWSEKDRVKRSIEGGGGKRFVVEQSRLSRVTGERLLVWSWYRIGGQDSADPYRAKLSEAWLRMTEGRRDGALIAVAAPYTDSEAEAEAILTRFLAEMGPNVRRVLDGAVPAP